MPTPKAKIIGDLDMLAKSLNMEVMPIDLNRPSEQPIPPSTTLGRACVRAFYVGPRGQKENMGTAMHRCPVCNSATVMALPQRGGLEAVVRCVRCSVLVILDSQPSAPQSFPAETVTYNRTVPRSQAEEIQLSPALMAWRLKELYSLPS